MEEIAKTTRRRRQRQRRPTYVEYDEWEEFGAGSSFDVPAQSKLKVKVDVDTAYLCEYE